MLYSQKEILYGEIRGVKRSATLNMVTYHIDYNLDASKSNKKNSFVLIDANDVDKEKRPYFESKILELKEQINL